jgi:hypothetical protein
MDTFVKTTRYVSFDKNGSIQKISHKPDEDFDWFEIDLDEVKDLLSGKERLINYVVDYDFLEKRYTLKNKQDLNESQSKNAFIYEIPSILDEEPDIKIIQDYNTKTWRIQVSKDLEEYLDKQKVTIDPKKQYYSITKKGDPNILYRLLIFKDNEIPFEYDFEFDKTDISIYTVQRFSTYKYEVLNG